MNIRDLVKSPSFENSSVIEIDGWIVIIGGTLSVIDKCYGDNYLAADRVALLNSGLIDGLRKYVALLGGGDSIYFHPVRVYGGVITDQSGSLLGVLAEKLAIKEGEDWIDVDLSQYSKISLNEASNANQSNWFDIFKTKENPPNL